MKKWIWNGDNGDGTYTNPVLYTDYSDPDVIRVGEDFYMVASSFCNTPGLPVLHSKDLVNWKVISYVLDQIKEPGYDLVQHGHGVWAPSIRWHEGEFYVYYSMPDEGIFMNKAKNPVGPWSEAVCVKRVKGWIDPCPFWDDDGKAYLVNGFAKSRSGIKSILHMSPMSPDGTTLLGEGQQIFDGHDTQPTIEGPKMYKRNGYYYILAPAGSVKSGWQTALRSRKVYGPYEQKIVMMQGESEINGPHQGGWVDTENGENWFIHFQDVGNAGRVVHLQPMFWQNDWPVIGEDSGEGYGTPVTVWKKPDVGAVSPVISPEESDNFSKETLGLQWQWNGNHRQEWYRMENPGVRLFAQNSQDALCDQPHLLLQKWTAPSFTVRMTFDTSDMEEGDLAGMVSMGRFYTALAAEKKGKMRYMVKIEGTIGEEEKREYFGTIPEGEMKIGLEVREDGTGQFYFPDITGCWQKTGERFSFTPGYWVGVKYGMFASHIGEKKAGSIFVKEVLTERDHPFQ